MIERSERISLQDAQEKLAAAGDARYVTLFKHGTLELEFYRPQGVDPQQPHTRAEVYFVVAGRGWFVIEHEHGADRQRFGPGDVLYLPAGLPHRFEDFSPDFATWAIFSGP